MTVAPVDPAELADAFALVYGPGGDTGHAFRMIARGELNPGDVLVARRDGVMVGAVFASRLPGGVAVIWPPRAAGDDPAIEDELTAAALGHVAGVKAVQTLLPAEDVGLAGPLVRAGFRHVTRVWQMAAPAPDGEPRLTANPYPDCDPATFRVTLSRAHDASLDCPELHGLLTPDELLASYRDAADPTGWWLAVADDQPAGVLLLNGNDLTFLGVVPEFRGRGVGRFLFDLALRQSPTLSLIVDARNAPAFQLYRSAGLEVVGAREVFLHFPPPAAGTTVPKGRRS